MSSLALPRLGPAVDEVRQHLEGRPELLQIAGPETSGKSTLLHRLEKSVEGTDWVAIRISAPVRSPDSGPTALAQIVDGLRRSGRANGELSQGLEAHRSWRQQLDLVRGFLYDVGGNLLLLLDEPLLWPVEGSTDPYFRDCTLDVLRLVERAPGSKVVAGDLPSHQRPDKTLDLPLRSDPREWLCHEESWGTLAGAAARLAEEGSGRIEEFSPLEIRLLVAHFRLNELLSDKWALPARERSRRSLSMDLAGRLQNSGPVCASVRRAWAFLARARRPFCDDLLKLALPEEATEESADILKHGLLFQEEGQWVLHEMLREDALSRVSWLSEEQRRRVHRSLGEYYLGTLQAESDQLLSRTVEAFHHAAESADPEFAGRCRAIFVPQLNAAGRTLSLSGQFGAAAALFTQAIEWDGKDDYAHHYMAFNLDSLAEEPERVARHYQEAIDLRPDHPWWHSRWISFLIARGQSVEARLAWDDALDQLYPVMSSSGATSSVYLHLHRWVAALLLHRGELEFAHEVLDGVPARVLTQEPSFQSLRRYLAALSEVAQRGAFVPADRLLQKEPWWEAGPFLLPERLKENFQLTHWLPGRVEAVEDGEIQFRVARIPCAEPQVTDILRITADEDLLSAWKWEGVGARLEIGAFVEIGTYRNTKGQVQNRLYVHRRVPWQDLNLPTLHPDPDRYLLAENHAG